jgi:polyribonucleotide nucleotidyltransferase
MDFGAFVELVPGKDGLVHVSKMSSEFVKNPSEIVKEGDRVRVKVQEIDSQGRINLKMLTLPDGTPVNVPDSPPREERRGDRNSRPRERDNRSPRRDDRRRF